jgi:hypothetical protein
MSVFCRGNDGRKYLGTTAKGAHEGKLGCGVGEGKRCGGRRKEEELRDIVSCE